jgi:hypothetical protein
MIRRVCSGPWAASGARRRRRRTALLVPVERRHPCRARSTRPRVAGTAGPHRQVGAQFWPRPGVTLETGGHRRAGAVTLGEVGVSTELSASCGGASPTARSASATRGSSCRCRSRSRRRGGAQRAGGVRRRVDQLDRPRQRRIVQPRRELVLSGDSSFDGARLTIRRATVESGQDVDPRRRRGHARAARGCEAEGLGQPARRGRD